MTFRFLAALLSSCCSLQGLSAQDAVPDETFPISPAPEMTVNVRDCGAKGDGVTDDTAALHQALNQAKAKGPGAAVYLPAGKYVMASGNFNFDHMRNFTVYGDGPSSVLLEKNPEASVMDINDSQKVAVKKLILSRTDDTFTQGKIDSINRATKAVDVTIDPGFADPDAPILARADRFCVFRERGTGYFMSVNPVKNQAPIKLGDRRWRLHLNDIEPEFAGRPFALWWGPGGHGFSSSNTKNLLVEDVTYYGRGANAGMILFGSQGTFTFRRFNIDVPPGSNALISCGGGGQQINIRGKLVFDHCDFEKFDDDGVDILSTYTQIVAQPAPDKITAEHNESFHVGDEIATVDWPTKNEEHYKLLAITPVNNSSHVVLTLDHPALNLKPGQDPPNTSWEDGIKLGYSRVVDYNDATTSTEFLFCKFQCLRARPLNLKAQNCLIQSCTFYNCDGSPISAGPEGAWGEAPYVRNLTIRNCLFLNNVLTCIDIDFFQGMKSCISYGNKNILIEGNVFRQSGAFVKTPQRDPTNWRTIENYGSLAIHLHHCDGAIIRDNDFGDRAPKAPSYNPMVLIDHCKNVTLTNNKNLPESEVVQQDSEPMVSSDARP